MQTRLLRDSHKDTQKERQGSLEAAADTDSPGNACQTNFYSVSVAGVAFLDLSRAYDKTLMILLWTSYIGLVRNIIRYSQTHLDNYNKNITTEKGTLIHCWWECKLVQPPWKTVWQFLKKLRVELPYDPAIPLLGIYPKNSKTCVCKNICTPLSMAALFTEAKTWRQPKCPSTEARVKTVSFTQTPEYSSAIRCNIAQCNNVDGP